MSYSFLSFLFSGNCLRCGLAEYNAVGDKEAARDDTEIDKTDYDVGNTVVGELKVASYFYHALGNEDDEEAIVPAVSTGSCFVCCFAMFVLFT